MSPAKPARFALRLRVPGWCQGADGADELYRSTGRPVKGAVRLSVNGKPVTAFSISKGYAVLERTWKKGDTVVWTMPMPVRRITSNPAVQSNLGKVALQRGPIVYCLEQADNGERVRRTAVPESAPIKTEWRPDLLMGVTVLKGTGVAQESLSEPPASAPFTAVPYYSWNNRGAEAMVVWVPASESMLPGVRPPTLASTSSLTWSFAHGSRTAPNDLLVPRSSHDLDTPHFDWWPRTGGTEWLQMDFASPQTISGAEVYWYHDVPGGRCAVPKQWRVETRQNGEWQAVEAPTEYGVDKDRFNRVTFKPVATDAVRLVVDCQPDFSAGVYEWKLVQ
jgi:hypothetical protein